MIIHQKDQYTITMQVKQGNTIITDENVDEMTIKVGELEKSLSKEEIYYDSEHDLWCYKLEKSQTDNMTMFLFVQVQFKIGENIFNSDVEKIDMRSSIVGVECQEKQN